MRTALVTGGAGFIGSHLVERLLAEDWRIVIVDNFDNFYDPRNKRANIKRLSINPHLSVLDLDIRDRDRLRKMTPDRIDAIVHLAAKAGVQPSIAAPLEYQDVNVQGTHNMLELAREKAIQQFIFASSSSVYGANNRLPWREDDHVLLPISPYASTKASGELLGHTYSWLFGIRFVALRFFTVFGPRQRPDLAIHKFARLLKMGREIPVHGDGTASRDYTHVDDIVSGIGAAMGYRSSAYETINLGSERTVSLMELIRGLELVSGLRADIRTLPAQPGDVSKTWADISKARALLGYKPGVDFLSGLDRFWKWFIADDVPGAMETERSDVFPLPVTEPVFAGTQP